MAYRQRNRDGIQFADLRLGIDPHFEELHDGLEDAYYGTPVVENGKYKGRTKDGWRDGVSSPWNGFDVQATPTESKAQFDRIHGEIFHARHVVFHEENLKRPTPYPREKYDDEHNDPNNEKRVTGRRSDTSRQRMRDLRGDVPGLIGVFETFLRGRGFTFDVDA